jgi:hypothetical protein
LSATEKNKSGGWLGRRWQRHIRLRWVLILALAGTGYAGWRALNPPPPPPPPPSAKVEKADITQLVQAAGVLQAKTKVDVGAQVSGQIQTLHVQLGQQVKKGDWLMINYVAANHDPAQFPDPRRFDAARVPNRHLAFGAGAHQCLGLHLARLEMRILFEELLPRLRSLEFAGELFQQRRSVDFIPHAHVDVCLGTCHCLPAHLGLRSAAKGCGGGGREDRPAEHRV